MHTPWRICGDIARRTVARWVHTDSAHQSSQCRAMSFRTNATTMPCRRTPQPDSFTRVRVRSRKGRRKHSVQESQNEQRKNKRRMFLFLRTWNGSISMLSARTEHATHLHQRRTQSHEPASLPTGLSASGALVARLSLHPLSRNGISNANHAARRQRPCACIRNALRTTGKNTIRSTYATNLALTRCELRQTQHHVTGAIGANADANLEPTKWAPKPPAKGEAQQLGFAVCSPVPCPQSGRRNKTQKRARTNLTK